VTAWASAPAAFHEIWLTAATPAPIAATEAEEPTDIPLRVPPPADGVGIRFTEMEAGARLSQPV
jgi:hypothetical protein